MSAPITAPCGAVCVSADLAMTHVVQCHTCQTIIYARERAATPFHRTITMRRQAAADARESLGRYGADVSEERAGGQVLRLGWALAHISHALWAETRGKSGNEHETARSALLRFDTEADT